MHVKEKYEGDCTIFAFECGISYRNQSAVTGYQYLHNLLQKCMVSRDPAFLLWILYEAGAFKEFLVQRTPHCFDYYFSDYIDGIGIFGMS